MLDKLDKISWIEIKQILISEEKISPDSIAKLNDLVINL